MGKYADLLLTGDDQATAPAPTQAAPGKYARQLLEPEQTPVEAPPAKQEGWGEWINNSIRGRRDPKEAATGTVYEQFTDRLNSPTATGAMLGANDAGMGDIIQKELGGDFIRREKDANGYEVIVTRGPGGQEQRGYVNKPGLDTQDAWRAFYGAAPYIATGTAAGTALKGAGVGLNALAQAATAATTSVAGDVGATLAGSEQGVDFEKAGVIGAFGGASPVVGAAGSALWRQFVTIPGLIDKATGQLTAKGIEAARRAGVEPGDVTKEFAQSFAKNFAKTGDEAAAATQASLDPFGIPATRGQMTKDPYLLTKEEGMRRRLYGESAQDTMRGFDAKQSEAVRYAALGNDGAGGAGNGTFAPKQGIGETLNPGRQPGAVRYDREAGSLGLNAQEGLKAAKAGAKAQEREAWEGVKDLAATPEALAILPDRVMAKLANETGFTAAGKEAAELITKFANGEAPETVVGAISLKPIKSVDQMRRKIGSIVGSAANPEDKRQAAMIYDAVNEWIGEAAEKSLLSGDPAKALQMVKARGFTREINQVFRPTTEAGRKSSAAGRLEKIMNADSGEAVIDALFNSQGSKGVSDGAVATLKNLKRAMQQYAPADVAEQAWNDVRLAHWARLVTGKNGELVGPTAMLNNIKTAMSNQRSVFNELYTPADAVKIRQFIRALETISYKPPNASGSGYSAATFAQEGVKRLLDTFGLTKTADAALQLTGVGNAVNAASARSAVNQITRPVQRNIAPAAAAAGNALYIGQTGGGR